MTEEGQSIRAERLRAIDSLLQHPGWIIFAAELGARTEQKARESRNLTLPHAQRDGAAGAANELESMGRFLADQKAQIESETRKSRALTKRTPSG